MSSEVQVFLPKFRNKQQYKCIIERSFNEAIEEAQTSTSPKNRLKKGQIDVVTPHKELDKQLAQDIISIKPQSGAIIQLNKLSELRNKFMNSSIQRQISPSKIMGEQAENSGIKHYHRSQLYKNYKYKSLKDDFDRDLLNNSCDVIKNKSTKSKIRDFQFQLYHRKHSPTFELTEEIFSQHTGRDSIQFNFPHSLQQSEQKSQIYNAQDEQSIQNIVTHQNNNNANDQINKLQFNERALIKTMKNSLDTIKHQRSKSEMRSKKIEKSDKLNEYSSMFYGNEQYSNRVSTIQCNNHTLSSLPPIFSIDQFAEDIDNINGFTKLSSKGRQNADKQIFKDMLQPQPLLNMMSPTFSMSPSQKCRTESNYRRRSSSINDTNFTNRSESSNKNIKYNNNTNQKVMITNPSVEDERNTVKLDSIIKQQKVRNIQEISEKIHTQIGFNSNEIKEAMDSIRIHFWGSVTKDRHYRFLSKDQLYHEFLSLCQVSNKVLELHRQNNISLPTETKKNQLKLMDLIKETDNTILIEVMNEAFPILKENVNTMNQRILDSLNFRLPKFIDKSSFYTIGWEEFLNFIQIAITKSASLTQIANFLIKFFNQSQHKYIQVEDFLYTLKTVCSKVDKYVDSNSKKNIYTAFEQNFKLLGFIKPRLSVFSSNQLRTAILENKINHYELIDLIFENF